MTDGPILRLLDAVAAPWRAALLVALVTCAAALAGVFTLPPLDRDEARFAQATAQMLESGDPIRINFQDEPRHKKPVGIHWLQAMSVSLLSSPEAREIWAYRLPSVLGALIAALCSLFAGRSLLGNRAGLAAGLLVGTTILLASEGGIAKTDAMLTAMTALAFLSLVKVRLAADAPDDAGQAPRIWALIGWLALGFGALIKGPVTPMAMTLAIITLTVWERRADWWRPYLHWSGPLLAGLILLPWLIAVELATDGAFLADALGQDLGPKLVSGHEGHSGPIGTHLLMLPILFFPAILLLPTGLAAAITALRHQTSLALAARLCLAFAVPLWLVFEFLPTKLVHYVLPAYPVLAILAGWGFESWARAPRWTRLTGTALLLLALAAIAGIVIAIPASYQGPWMLAIAGMGVVGLLSLAAAAAGLLRHAGTALLLAVVTGLTCHIVGRGIIAPRTQDLFLSPQIVAAIDNAGLRPQGTALYSSYTEPSLVFALGGNVSLIDSAALAGLSGQSGPLTVIIDETRLADADRPTVTALDATACARTRVSGFNYSRGDPTSVLILNLGSCEAGERQP